MKRAADLESAEERRTAFHPVEKSLSCTKSRQGLPHFTDIPSQQPKPKGSIANSPFA